MVDFSIAQSMARQLAEAWYQTILDEIREEQEVDKSQEEQLIKQNVTKATN